MRTMIVPTATAGNNGMNYEKTSSFPWNDQKSGSPESSIVQAVSVLDALGWETTNGITKSNSYTASISHVEGDYLSLRLPVVQSTGSQSTNVKYKEFPARLVEDIVRAVLKPEVVKRIIEEEARIFRIVQFTHNLKSNGFSRSSGRILELLKYERNEGPEEGESPLSIQSVEGYCAFMQKFSKSFSRIFRVLGEPLIGAFSKGTLCAEWRLANDGHLVIEFIDERNLEYAIKVPSTDRRTRRRWSGLADSDEVFERLTKVGVDRW